MIGRDRKADQCQGKHVTIGFGIFKIDGNAKDRDQRIHRDALVPTQNAWQKMRDLAEVETPRHRDHRNQKCGGIQIRTHSLQKFVEHNLANHREFLASRQTFDLRLALLGCRFRFHSLLPNQLHW